MIAPPSSTDPISDLPTDLSVSIFFFLPWQTVGTIVSRVCKKWQAIASDKRLWNPSRIFPKVNVFDRAEWVKHVNLASLGLSVDDISELTKKQMIPLLKNCLSSLPIADDAGITLLTIPKGLTFKKLFQIAQSPKIGHVTPIKCVWARFFEVWGDIEVGKTYRIVISNSVLKGSRYITDDEQQALADRTGCALPQALETAVLLVVTYMHSTKRLFHDNPITFSRCREKIDGFHPVIGNFSTEGFCIYTSQYGPNFEGFSGVVKC